jgi:hypothetical protein
VIAGKALGAPELEAYLCFVALRLLFRGVKRAIVVISLGYLINLYVAKNHFPTAPGKDKISGGDGSYP